MKVNHTNSTIDTLLNETFHFIAKEQATDGSFSHTTSHVNDSATLIKPSPFITALISQALSAADSPISKKISKQAVDFLLTQKSTHWTFNYQTRDSFSELKYPDDLDDTCTCLLAIHSYRSELVDGSVLSKFIQVVTQLEDTEGGPYKTWLVNDSAPLYFQDVDVAVNANIARFLKTLDITLPNMTTFFDISIKNKSLSSSYYVSDYPVIYFLSNVLEDASKPHLLSYVKKYLTHTPPHSTLQKIFLSTTLLKLNDTNLAAQYINELTAKYDGSFEADAFIREPFNTQHNGVTGSAALTAALFCEMILIWKKKQTHIHHTQELSGRIHTKIVKEIESHQQSLPKELLKVSNAMLSELFIADADKQITLLPWYFSTLLKDVPHAVDTQYSINLGVCNVYGWASYNIYDDILDDDTDSAWLGIANIWQRKMTTILTKILINQPDVYEYCQKMLAAIDAANTWEYTHCRFKPEEIFQASFNVPDFKQRTILADKSLGHALGPLVILMLAGHGSNTKVFKELYTFFQQYLIAKQLNDDAHDWKDDFQKGRHTPITTHLLKKYQATHTIYTINSNDLITELNKMFWESEILEVTKMITTHVKKAKKSLLLLEEYLDTKMLKKYLLPIEESVAMVKNNHKNTTQFLQTYEQTVFVTA